MPSALRRSDLDLMAADGAYIIYIIWCIIPGRHPGRTARGKHARFVALRWPRAAISAAVLSGSRPRGRPLLQRQPSSIEAASWAPGDWATGGCATPVVRGLESWIYFYFSSLLILVQRHPSLPLPPRTIVCPNPCGGHGLARPARIEISAQPWRRALVPGGIGCSRSDQASKGWGEGEHRCL
eukprot:COSAG01_NODE_597_length_15020_cov_195.298170_2_plen_182_part_00